MKRALLSTFVMALVGINAFCYEYVIYSSLNKEGLYLSNNNGVLTYRYINQDGAVSDSVGSSSFYTTLGSIRRVTTGYVSCDVFDDYFKNDEFFLNDLYSQQRNPFMNYLYNSGSFSSSDYLVYDSAKILYDKKGRAVASVYNGKWGGKYNDADKYKSGTLYDSSGKVAYMNGYDVDQMSYFDWGVIPRNINQSWNKLGIVVGVLVAFSLCMTVLSKIWRDSKHVAFGKGKGSKKGGSSSGSSSKDEKSSRVLSRFE